MNSLPPFVRAQNLPDETAVVMLAAINGNTPVIAAKKPRGDVETWLWPEANLI